ncbi:hypothetical protein OG866_02865 [Streptomyces sp. NBC_00663]|uniref:hypothetical protein n=1 Tax=Streptomyces sp. NBC_00663 TaxID=2975801 RepID=UPI002E378215|nr:hypothetical protein [Streptomyces sp. NBC_00663]
MDDPWQALTGFLETTLTAQLTDPSLPLVRAAPVHVLPRTKEITGTLDSLAGRLLDRAHAAGAVRTATMSVNCSAVTPLVHDRR